MSSGHFARSSRNTSQRNANKSEQVTEASTNPSQISGITVEQNSKSGYVYRPPTRIMRSNINPVKEPVEQKVQKVQPKKQQIKEQPQTQQGKPLPFVRKSANETSRSPIVEKSTVETKDAYVKEQVKPIVKPVSRLTANRTNDPLAMLGLAPQKKQLPPKTSQPQNIKSPQQLPKSNQIKRSFIEEKPQIKQNITENFQPKSSESIDTNSKSSHTVQTKKPSPFSYPKRISRKEPQNQIQIQQNQTNQRDQPVQQTPKFNRVSKQEKPENPPVSSFQYQRKNVPQTTSSQSSNNLKPYPKVIQPQVQNIDSPKTLQSSSKSSISHASRYSNIDKKIQTPKTTKQQTKSEQQISAKPIKRSPIIIFSLNRLYFQKVHSFFSQIYQFSRYLKQNKSNQKHFQFVERTLLKFVKNYQKNALTRGAFGLMKSINSKTLKLQMIKSNDPKITNQLISNRNQCFGRVFENIVAPDSILVKEAFKTLKSILIQKKVSEKKIQNGAKVLGNLESRRLKQFLKELCEWANYKNSSKEFKMTRCSEINIKYKKFLIWEAYKNISLFKLKELASESKSATLIQKQPPRSLLNQEIEAEESQTNKELKTKIFELEGKLSQLSQKSSTIPKQSDLRKTFQELKEDKQLNSEQLETKNQRNTELKRKLESLMSNKAFNSQQEFQSLSENKAQNQQPTLSLLHQIYMKIYKQSQQQCIAQENISSLCVIHRVDENKLMREIVAKWLAIQQNLTLKHEINLYEGNYVSESIESATVKNIRKMGKQLQQENQIIKKFIGSYIKERYMWEEVKEYVAAVIIQ